jgi:hypothetical protein
VQRGLHNRKARMRTRRHLLVAGLFQAMVWGGFGQPIITGLTTELLLSMASPTQQAVYMRGVTPLGVAGTARTLVDEIAQVLWTKLSNRPSGLAETHGGLRELTFTGGSSCIWRSVAAEQITNSNPLVS